MVLAEAEKRLVQRTAPVWLHARLSRTSCRADIQNEEAEEIQQGRIAGGEVVGATPRAR